MLKSVVSIKRTQHEDMLDFRLVIGDGTPVMKTPVVQEGEPPLGPVPTGEIEWTNEREVEYSWRRGDTASIGPDLDRWLIANPDFPIDPADPIPPPTPPLLSLQQVAAARLHVQDWEVTGVEQSQGIAGAFLLDTDLAMVLFTEDFPDTEYIVMPPEGVTKHTGYVEVSRPGLSSISFIIMRVQ